MHVIASLVQHKIAGLSLGELEVVSQAFDSGEAASVERSMLRVCSHILLPRDHISVAASALEIHSDYAYNCL